VSRRRLTLRAAALTLLVACCALRAAEGASEGERIYREGLQASGEPLRAERGTGLPLTGAAAACINCHRRSGLGMKEGRTSIPPVAGSYLYHPRAGEVDDLDLPFVEGMRADRDPYTDATLAQAIRTGIGADGKPLGYLMPHYALGDEDMAALIAYLRHLSPGKVPGVTEQLLHFATVVTPDADPVTRAGVLDVLEQFFADKNHYRRGDAPRLRSSRRMMFKAFRTWQLHVWELHGASETWEAQLRDYQGKQPVFAVISGVGGRDWSPVHRFCEAQSLPCLFPNVDLPVAAEGQFDNLYLSKGVLLEAGLVAHDVAAQKSAGGTARIVQVFRTDDVGREAARELATRLAPEGVTSSEMGVVPGTGSAALKKALRKVRPGDALMLWLRAGDLAMLGAPPKGVTMIYVSGRMGGLEASPLPGAWRALTRMAYPFDLPDARRVRVDFPMGWFRIRDIPVVAQQAQVDTWMACGIVSDALNHMADTFVRDYLVERIEEMLEHRLVTGYYPRLALAPNQRFASKGGYIVRFAAEHGTRIVAQGEWITPP